MGILGEDLDGGSLFRVALREEHARIVRSTQILVQVEFSVDDLPLKSPPGFKGRQAYAGHWRYCIRPRKGGEQEIASSEWRLPNLWELGSCSTEALRRPMFAIGSRCPVTPVTES